MNLPGDCWLRQPSRNWIWRRLNRPLSAAKTTRALSLSSALATCRVSQWNRRRWQLTSAALRKLSGCTWIWIAGTFSHICCGIFDGDIKTSTNWFSSYYFCSVCHFIVSITLCHQFHRHDGQWMFYFLVGTLPSALGSSWETGSECSSCSKLALETVTILCWNRHTMQLEITLLTDRSGIEILSTLSFSGRLLYECI